MRKCETDAERGPGAAGACLPWGIVALAFAVRITPIRNVFVDGETYFTDSDSYYHLRRIAYNLAEFPRTLDRDLYLNFPEGAKAIWPQTLDWILALLLWPLHAADPEQDFERILVWVPPILGSLTVWLLYRIALRHFGARVATISALVLSVLSGHFWYSQIGFLDHHVVVALCATLLLGATMDLMDRCDEATVSRKRLLRQAIGFGALLAFNLMIWPGAFLYVALAEAALLGLLVASSSFATRRYVLDCLLAANLAALVLIAPFCFASEWPQWGEFSALVLSRFQPWWFATLALHAGLSSLLFDRAFKNGVALRVAVMSLLGALLLGASMTLLPGLEESVRDSAQWLGRTDSFQVLVGESVPLFILHGEFTTQVASSRLSYFIYLFPMAMAWLAFEWRTAERRPALYSFVGWVLVLFGFTLLQKRFFNTFSVGLALTMGIALSRVHDLLAERVAIGRSIRIGSVTLAALVLLAPSLWVYSGSVVGIAKAMSGAPRDPDHRTETNRLRREMTSWLRRNTPETSGFLDSRQTPEYGVLARWGEGHFIKYVARRPTVMGNFGDDLGREHFLLARSFFTAEPSRAEEILESLGVRYLVIRSMSESRVMAKTLFVRDGSRLGRYRLLYEVRPRRGGDVPSYKLFEFVKGAKLSGRAPPRSLVKAELDLTTNLGRETRFETVTESDATGHYRLRLPYATRGYPGSITTAERYQIRVGDTREGVAIDESAVQQGASVAGPSF